MIRDTPPQACDLHEPGRTGDGSIVFAFDRDYTVGSNPPTDDDWPGVPLAWIAHLAHNTEHLVYATGNQMLTSEAEIPGIPEILEAHPDATDDSDELSFDDRPDRRERVDMLRDIYPEADEYIVVDDIDLSDMDGWTHYYSWTFVPEARSSGIPDLPPNPGIVREIGPMLDPRTTERFDIGTTQSTTTPTS
ncbi:hypothetical protein [Halorhabdus rudnickae]|uniref:hypothetical protein n=1 Tax=Halorhabdus rudnickae TaxID=1775544 RepID=UPI001082B400|nr:hypothetical protein [Halorhabdus rudnickae]